MSVGGLGIYPVPTGSDLDLSDPTVVAYSTKVVLDDSYLKGAGRVVGCGFEAVNTTAEIYQQGQVTVYRMPQSNPQRHVWLVIDPSSQSEAGFSGHTIRCPPLNQATAMLLPGSRQWKAKEGCYVVQSFVGQDNPPVLTEPLSPVVFTRMSEDSPASVGSDLALGPTLQTFVMTNDPVTTQYVVDEAMQIYPIHMGGAVFTGLSENTTLTFTSNVYFESFPTPSDPAILVLATPSAQYDPVALEIFSRILTLLPVGVPAGDNEDGDWFDAIASLVRDIAPVAAPFLAAVNPALGAGAVAAGGAAGAYLAAQTPKTKPVLTPAPKPAAAVQVQAKKNRPKRKKNKNKNKSA